MTEGKKYLLETSCTELEEHDGERWIDEDEYNKIKQQVGTISPGCSICRLKVKDADGNVLFIKEGC